MSRLNRALAAVTHLRESDGRPTVRSIRNAHRFLKLIPPCVRDETGLWATANGTVEFDCYRGRADRFIFEASDNGVSGFVRIHGVDACYGNGAPGHVKRAAMGRFARLTRPL